MKKQLLWGPGSFHGGRFSSIIKKTLQSLQPRPRRYRRPLHRVSACDCVTDESERLPWGGLLLGNGDHSPPVFFETTIFSKWVVLAIPPRRPPPQSENNHLQCVCQLFEKLTTVSNCTYYSGFWNSWTPAVIAYLRLPVGTARSAGRSSRFHTPGAETCARTWLHLVSSRPR